MNPNLNSHIFLYVFTIIITLILLFFADAENRFLYAFLSIIIFVLLLIFITLTSMYNSFMCREAPSSQPSIIEYYTENFNSQYKEDHIIREDHITREDTQPRIIRYRSLSRR